MSSIVGASFHLPSTIHPSISALTRSIPPPIPLRAPHGLAGHTSLLPICPMQRTSRSTARGAGRGTARVPTSAVRPLLLLFLLFVVAAGQNGPDDDWRAYLRSGWERLPQFRDPDGKGRPYCGPCRFFDPASGEGGACRYWENCTPSGRGAGGRNCGACFAYVNDNALGHCARVDVACG
jgi:hypothetical protein